MENKIVLKGKKIRDNVLSDALFFGLGRTLQELLDLQSGFSTLKSIGYNMILYLEEKKAGLKIIEDPLETIKNIWSFMIKNNFAESVEIESEGNSYAFSIHNTVSCKASGRLCKIYGEKNHLIPCPFFILLLAAMGKIGYDVIIKGEDYKDGACVLKLDIRKIKFTNTG